MGAVQIAAGRAPRRYRRRHGLPLFPVQKRSVAEVIAGLAGRELAAMRRPPMRRPARCRRSPPASPRLRRVPCNDGGLPGR